MPRHPPCALHNNSHNTYTTQPTHTVRRSHRCTIRQYHQVNKHTTTKNCITKKEDTRVHYTVLTQHKQHTHTNHTSGQAMHHFPRRHNAPDTQQTQQTKPQTHKPCILNFLNSPNYPPQGSHQTQTHHQPTRAGTAQLNTFSIYMGCAFLPTMIH